MHERTTRVNEEDVQTRLCRALGITISNEEAAMLLKHMRCVIETNKTINLTSITNEEAGMLLHIEDSLRALQEVNSAIKGDLVDLGSGGGYPGIPLAIVSRRNTTLVEATQKKARVLQSFIKEANKSDQIGVIATRIEEYSTIKECCYAVATARALAPLSALMELAAPLLMNGGTLIAYKGKLSEEELQRAKNAEDSLGMELVNRRAFLLSDDNTQRELVVYKKINPPKITLPRRFGKAQQHPL